MRRSCLASTPANEQSNRARAIAQARRACHSLHPVKPRPFLVFAGLVSLLQPSIAGAKKTSPTDAGPADVTIESVTYSGSGCPSGSAVTSITPDGQTFEIGFSSYIAAVGQSLPASEARRDCVLVVDFAVPRDSTYSVANVEYRGFAELDSDVVGSRASTYHFAGEPPDPVLKDDLVGPMDDVYDFADQPFSSGPLTSACGKGHRLRIHTAVKVDGKKNPTGSGLMTTDETDGVIESWHLNWQPCTP
jgi:Domain of unknown function (DUF4360)